MPYFSIIIPVYNRPDEVNDLLESLSKQTYKDFEVIIVEDGSTVCCADAVKIFHRYYADLVRFTARFIPDKSTCEDIVQEAFIKLWTNRKRLETDTSISSYLISLVQNLALNELRHTKVKMQYQDMNHEIILSLSPEEHMFFSELYGAYETALAKLDPEVRETLLLSRQEKLKYAEIAQRLDISVRTVEARISKALKFLQHNLQIYRVLLFITLCACNFL